MEIAVTCGLVLLALCVVSKDLGKILGAMGKFAIVIFLAVLLGNGAYGAFHAWRDERGSVR